MVRRGFRYARNISKTILYIDGQNFLKLAGKALFGDGDKKFDSLKLNFKGLFDRALGDLKVDERRFYAAKIRRHPDSVEQSEKLIENQRLLKTKLEQEGFETIIAGSVRGNYVKNRMGKPVLVFKEKGVDVRLAVDSVAEACDKVIKTAVVCSSDSDLQPAVSQLKQRGVTVVYVGFESLQNKGLTYTCDRTILFRDAELRLHYGKSEKKK